MAIVIAAGTSDLCQRIIRRTQRDVPILENPIGSNRSPEIDAMCDRWGVPRGSYWCALWAASCWADEGAEVPPTRGDSHPAKCQSWLEWAKQTGRWSRTPRQGYAVLYDEARNGKANHMGTCVVSTDPILMDFEGNTSLAGFGRNGELATLKPVNLRLVLGYVSPQPISGAVTFS
jgi:hypothetical protein